MLDPDSTRVVPTHPGAPGSGLDSPHALQILTTEHWSLLSSRSLGYTEAMSRASIYVAALTGSVVALALVGQATGFDDAFLAFALVLLPVVFFLGFVTIARLAQITWEDANWVQGMNRIRHAYLELAPELEPYFVTSKHDDDEGVLITTLAVPRVAPGVQSFIAIPASSPSSTRSSPARSPQLRPTRSTRRRPGRSRPASRRSPSSSSASGSWRFG